MTDQTTVHIGENSPEQVAFKLMSLVAEVEGRENYAHGAHPMDREWILRTYAQCLAVVHRANGEKEADKFKPESFARPSR